MPIDDEVWSAAIHLDDEIALTSRKPVEGSPIMEATDLPEDALELPYGRPCGS